MGWAIRPVERGRNRSLLHFRNIANRYWKCFLRKKYWGGIFREKES